MQSAVEKSQSKCILECLLEVLVDPYIGLIKIYISELLKQNYSALHGFSFWVAVFFVCYHSSKWGEEWTLDEEFKEELLLISWGNNNFNQKVIYGGALENQI